MSSKSKILVIPIFIPHKGCPHDCNFCNQRSISGSMQSPTDTEVIDIVEFYLNLPKTNRQTEVAFFGGSFTAIPVEEQERYLSIIQPYIKNKVNQISGIRLSTRPDYIDDKILQLLKNYNVKTIEIGAQSMDDKVLEMSRRGHTASDIIKASQLIKSWDIKLGIQTMLGLHGSSYQTEINTAHSVVEIKPDFVRIYPTLVVKGTVLADLYTAGLYQPLQLDSAINTCADILDIYDKGKIDVIRVGLQATDHINYDGDVLAGPFHPAFGQLAYSRLYFTQIKNKLDLLQPKPDFQLQIFVPPGEVSTITGQKKCNIIALQNEYGFHSIKVIEDFNLKSGFYFNF